MPDQKTPGIDRYLVVEAVLAIAFFGLTVGLFLIPAATPPFLPGWWVGFLLAILFFGIVFLETFRRRARGRAELRRSLDDHSLADPGPASDDPDLG